MPEKIIQRDRSIVPACDVTDIVELAEIVEATKDIDAIGGYKVGFSLALPYGLPRIVEVIKGHADKPVIYDHQKAGTDIPDTGGNFTKMCKTAGVDAVILFPESGPATEYEWIKATQDNGLGVIVGGEMTHPRYLEGDFSEGKKQNYTEIFENLGITNDLTGFIRPSAPVDMYILAARMGVTNFVVPGNKPYKITFYKGIVEINGAKEPTFWSPGLVAQGGEISEGAKAAGERFHAIVGRGIYKAEDKRAAALELTSKL